MLLTHCSAVMSTPVFTIGADSSALDAQIRLAQHRVSSLVVEGHNHDTLGLITRRDLIRVSEQQRTSGGDVDSGAVPAQKVRSLMSRDLVWVDPTDSVRTAASRMVRYRVHRVLVGRSGHTMGVLSTLDVAKMLITQRSATPVARFASGPVRCVAADVSVATAKAQLDGAEIGGIVVISDDGWPQAVFTEVEALALGAGSGTMSVGDVANPRVIVVSPSTPVYRAAARAVSLRSRRVLVMEGSQLTGILSGLDFARAAAEVPLDDA